MLLGPLINFPFGLMVMLELGFKNILKEGLKMTLISVAWAESG